MTEINNSDIKVIGNKIDNLVTQVNKLETKQDTYHSESQKRLAVAEQQLALSEQSYLIVCKDIEGNEEDIAKLEERQKKNDLLTKIITGFQGLLTLALIYLGIREG
jgi:hypothetical protein